MSRYLIERTEHTPGIHVLRDSLRQLGPTLEGLCAGLLQPLRPDNVLRPRDESKSHDPNAQSRVRHTPSAGCSVSMTFCRTRTALFCAELRLP
jgi:hypothetical protein